MAERDAELDRKLSAFLDDMRELDFKGMTRRVFEAFTEHEKKDDERHKDVLRLVRGLDRRITEFEEKEETTGRHELAVLRKKLAWWQRLPIRAVMFLAGGVALAVIGAVVERLIH